MSATGGTAAETLHASCVALDERSGLLILGPAGAGKSTLALELMAYGATLVSDDGVEITREGDAVTASAPAAISGMIEARGIGLLSAATLPRARLTGVVDLSHPETERLPPERTENLLGIPLPLIYRVEGAHFAPALIQWLKGGRRA